MNTPTPPTIGERLLALGFVLPAVRPPTANYVATVRSGNLLFVAGQTATKDEAPFLPGRLGAERDVDEGRRAAEVAALHVIARIVAATDDRASTVRRIVRLGVFVAGTPEFTAQPEVANGASDLFVAVFGDAGRHARAAVGVTSLPDGASVEIDAVVELAP